MSLQNITRHINRSLQSLTQSFHSLHLDDPEKCENLTGIRDDLAFELRPMFSSQKVKWSSSSVFHDGAIGVSVRDLAYGRKGSDKPILNDVNLFIPRGKIYGLLGPSGCGKTTLLQCIVGYLKPQKGKILLLDKSHQSLDLLIPGRNVGYMPQESALFELMTIEEILHYYGRIFLMTSEEIKTRIGELIQQLELPKKSQKIKDLSGGQQRRVSFAVALIHCPPLIILDEPTSGVDPVLRESIWSLLLELTYQQNCTIIITTHYIEEANRSHLVGFMRNGRILKEGSPTNLLQKYSTLEAAFLELCLRDSSSDLNERDSSLAEVKYNFQAKDTAKKRSGKRRRRRLQLESGGPKEEVVTSALISNIKVWFTVMSTLFVRYFKDDVLNVSSLVYQYLIPLSQSFMVAYCLGGQPYDIPVGLVINELEPDLGTKFSSVLDSKFFRIKNYTSMEDAAQDVARRELWGVIGLQPSYSDAFHERLFGIDRVSEFAVERSKIVLLTDVTDRIIFESLHSVLLSNIKQFARLVLKSDNDSRNMEFSDFLANSPIQAAEPIYGTYYEGYQGLRDFIFPAAVVNLGFSAVYTLFALSLLRERFSQSFERNFVAGVKTYQLVLALAFSRTLLMIPMFLLITILPILAIGFPITITAVIRSLPLLTALTIGGISLGMLINILCDSIAMATIFSVGLMFALVFTSGSIWPLESLNPYLRFFTHLGPTTWPTKAVRNMFYKNSEIFHREALIAFGSILIWTLACFLIGAKFLRK